MTRLVEKDKTKILICRNADILACLCHQSGRIQTNEVGRHRFCCQNVRMLSALPLRARKLGTDSAMIKAEEEERCFGALMVSS